MTPTWPRDPWSAVKKARNVRVTLIHGMGPDTFTVIDGGEVSLVDRATLISLLKQLGKEDPP